MGTVTETAISGAFTSSPPIRPEDRATPAIYGGLFFTTLSTLMYEVLLTRIFSVTMWYHFAFVAVSVALFGMTVGALIIHLMPAAFRTEDTRTRLAQASLLFSVSVVFAFLTHLAIPFEATWSITSIYSIMLTYLVISVPFIFSGITVALALTRFPGQVSRLYSVDLVGAGLGTVTLVWVLNLLGDGPSAVVIVAALAAVGACLFAAGARTGGLLFLAALLVLFWTVGGVGNAIGAQHNHALLRVRWTKVGGEERAQYERWNAFSRIRVTGDSVPLGLPFGWGFSNALPHEPIAHQLTLNLDAAAATFLTKFDGDTSKIDYLRYDVTNAAHYLRSDARVFVVGAGGGRDVLAALLFKQQSVTAVEINNEIIKAVNGKYGDFTGHLDRQPNVRFVNDEARSHLARSDERYDIIQISLIDTWAATAAGAFALSENSLYTVEAWQTFFDHLTPDGVLSVSRWFRLDAPPIESYRLTALAAEALRRHGIDNPRDHIMLVRNSGWYSFAPDAAVGNMIVSLTPFSPADVAKMQQTARDLQFELVMAPPPAPSDPTFAAVADASDPNSVDVGLNVDISAPTDNRPFFFQMIRFQDVFDLSLYKSETSFLTQPVLVLFSLALAMLVLTGLCILLPVLLMTRRESLRGMTPFIVFFSGIGLGFLLLEIAQLQRLIIFLGHPTYALSVVLFSLLIFSGFGSLLSEALMKPERQRAMLLPLAALLVVLVAVGIATPNIIESHDGATTPMRILTATALLAPMGLLMGMPFPIGMKLASLRENAPTAFFWGVNGATSVLASVLGIVIALQWGISIAFWAGVLCYAIAAAALARLTLVRA